MDWLKLVHPDGGRRLQVGCRPGDQVRVWSRIQERGRARVVSFEGIVLRMRGAGPSKTLTVRRVTFGEGVERVFLLSGPTLERIELVRRGTVKRSRLYYLRTLVGKSRIVSKEAEIGPETGVQAAPAAEAASESRAA